MSASTGAVSRSRPEGAPPSYKYIGATAKVLEGGWESLGDIGWFDEEGCADGIAHIGAYRKEWDEQHGVWKPTPRHDHTSHAADSFRQFAQEVSGGNVFREGYGGAGKRRASGSWRTA